MANGFAHFVLYLWPLVVLVVFSQRKGKASPARTAAWMLFLGLMFLPCGADFDAPLIPPIGKDRMGVLAVWLALQVFHRKDLVKQAPGHNMPRIIFGLMLAALWMSISTNGDTLYYGKTELPGHTFRDMLALTISFWLDSYLPFAVAQRVFRSERDLRDLLDVLVRCMLVYTPFILYELRMAPVLHSQLYGFAPFGFTQAIRAGGYRPAVFMVHGLVLAVFVFGGASAALALRATKWRLGKLSPGLVVSGLLLLLLLCKTLGAMLYFGATFLVLRRPVKPTRMFLGLVLIGAGVLYYPWARTTGQFPTYVLTEWATKASTERAASLQYRFDQEDVLIAKGQERAMWGWGAYGRNRVFDEEGTDVSVTDGTWVVWFGAFGYAGLGLNLLLTVLPLFRAGFRARRLRGDALPMLAGLGMIAAGLAVDILPNSRQDYFAMILTGALWTLSETLSRKPPPRRPRPAQAASAPVATPA